MASAPRRRADTFPARLRFVALVLPAILVTLLVLLDHVVFESLLPPLESLLATVAVGVAGVFAFSAVIFGQLTRLQESEARQGARLRELADSLEAKRAQLQALNQAGLSLSAELDPESVLQKIADAARLVGDARYAALAIFDEAGRMTQFLTSGITEEERVRIGPLPRGGGLLGLLPSERRPIRVRDIRSHPASVGFPPGHPPMRSFLGAPILWRGRSVGNLYLAEKRGAPEFSAEDEEALVTLAAQAAIAIENARLYAQAARVSVLEERHRIGMDLHDGVIQSLYGLGLLLEDAAARVDREPAVTRQELARAVDRLNAAISDLRNYVLGLRPILGSERPLADSLPSLAERVGANALLEVSVDVAAEAEGELDRAEREAVFYIAADALGNVARHARARHATVRLVREDDRVVLEVADDGVGFASGRSQDGLGLRNMRHRAFAVGGQLRVEARPGRGTCVRVELPIRSEAPR